MDDLAWVSLIIALGGWALAAFTVWVNKSQQQQQIFYQALNWLGGGTQKRSVGISVVEYYWAEKRLPSKQVSPPILINTVVYLLHESSQKAARHEIENLRRIMALLLGEPIKERFRPHFESLRDAIHDAAAAGEKPKRGLWVEPERLEAWRKKLEELLEKPA